VRNCSTTDSDSIACFSHQKGEHVSGTHKTAIISEEDCSENIPMACISIVSKRVFKCVHASVVCVLLFLWVHVCLCVRASVHMCVVDQLHTREAFTSIH